MKIKKILFFCHFITITSFYSLAVMGQQATYPFQDTAVSFEKRAEDLISRLTLQEKVMQMSNATPAIQRLGIPAYNWWNECLHGIALTPYNVTVYPQAIAMAATFDVAALKTMAYQTAIEGRAINAERVRKNQVGIYTGLTYWSPNVNIFRDPRWGRGQETYGEDPFLTKTLGDSFVKGLQGNDPKYLLAAACAKHYAVHSGPEHNRHSFNTTVSNYDLWDTYLPAFKHLVVESKVSGVMCAYNAYAGQPCCGSDLLMQDILRNKWDFKGYVTSDCGGIRDFFSGHKTSVDAKTAAADAVIHGTDVECGITYKKLEQAVKDGLLSESKLDESLKRLFLVRMRLGMFDPESNVKYAQIPLSILENPDHKAQALKMAKESIVLLRNDKNVLPLAKTIKKIAVFGPNANNQTAILGNYNGLPTESVTPLNAIKAKLPGAEVYYQTGIGYVGDEYLMPLNLAHDISHNGKAGLYAEYFGNKDLQGQPQANVWETNIDHKWTGGEPVQGNLSPKDLSIRWTGTFTPEVTQEYVFEIGGDDGLRLKIDGIMVLERWKDDVYTNKKYSVKMEKGKPRQIIVEHYQSKPATIKFTIGIKARADVESLALSAKEADAIVFIGGISPSLEGEEMGVDLPGFYKGDRTSIQLPEIQTRLLKALKTTGKPVIFVMMTGSAISTPWESENIPGILNAWYGGQSAGTAIADVLFGDYNPSGRLPVTFYKSDTDLPDFEDYSMQNRTYRYFKGKPLYPFGYGLSYTSFRYSELRTIRNTKKNNLIVNVRVTNTGEHNGEEVVQLYVSHPSVKKTAIRALKGFSRISLKKGETKNVNFTLEKQELTVVNELGKPFLPNGAIKISVGGSQPNAETIKNKKTVETTIALK